MDFRLFSRNTFCSSGFVKKGDAKFSVDYLLISVWLNLSKNTMYDLYGMVTLVERIVKQKVSLSFSEKGITLYVLVTLRRRQLKDFLFYLCMVVLPIYLRKVGKLLVDYYECKLVLSLREKSIFLGLGLESIGSIILVFVTKQSRLMVKRVGQYFFLG